MAFTTIDKMRLQLIGPTGAARKILNELVLIGDNGDGVLANNPIEEHSVQIKGITTNQIDSASVVLDDSNWTVFAPQNVVPNSVAVVDGPQLYRFYAENSDFLIDYQLGRIKRPSGSNITTGQGVTVFYQSYTFYTENVDYTFDYNLGTFKLATGGTILSGQYVWVDYNIAESGATDALLTEALEEAHAKIVARLLPGYSEISTDSLLAVGETELACAIAARALASKPLGISRDTTSDDRASAWLKLADQFERVAWQTLQKFISKPARKSGYAVKSGSGSY